MDNIRDADKTINERLINPDENNDLIFSETEKEQILDQIEVDLYNVIPNDNDNLDDLIVKLHYLKDEIEPKIINFNIYSSVYENIYKDINDRIDVFKTSMICEDNNRKKDKEMSVRELRMKYYNNKK